MCCGVTYGNQVSYGNSGGAGVAARSADSGQFWAVTPRGETREQVVTSHAEALTLTANGGGVRQISAEEAARINAQNSA